MLATAAAVLLLVTAASGDPETPKGSCAEFLENYRELLRARAEAEASPPSGAKAATAAAIAAAQQDAARVFELTRGRLEQSCRAADRAGWECVAQAATYAELGACRIGALPLVADGARVHDARRELEATAERERRRPESSVREWVSRGTVEVSPELRRAALDAATEPATSAAGDGERPAPPTGEPVTPRPPSGAR